MRPSAALAPSRVWGGCGLEASGVSISQVGGGQSWNLTRCPRRLQDANGPLRELRPRLCHLRKGPQGYGFNLHSDKSRPGQYIRSVDPGSPAAHSGLRAQDRLIEVPATGAAGSGLPRVYLCPAVHASVCLCLCVCVRLRVCLSVSLCICVCACVLCPCVSISVCVSALACLVCPCLCVCVHVRLCACVCPCVSAPA